LRNAFTKGTEQEVTFLWDALELQPGARVLDAGCGPGRHALALARRGCEVTGIDISEDFVELATCAAREQQLPATFVRGDVRDLAYDGEFDAVISLCQGGFGLLGGPGVEDPLPHDTDVLRRFARALTPGGCLALTAFSALFAVRFLEPGDTFDAATGVNHEAATVKDEEGHEAPFDLWTTCSTARELRLLASAAGLVVDGVHGVTPGRYTKAPPDLEQPELLLLARRP
jgi:SAM-dependent methyltransferase